MKIVVLDGYSANPGDLSWDCLSQYGELTVYDRSDKADVAARIGDAEAVITNKTVIDAEVLAACPGVRYIGVIATGYNVVDMEAARRHGVVVTNVPEYSTDTVAQFTFALILELANRVSDHSRSVMAGGWAQSVDFTYSVAKQTELAGRTLGVIGYGSIGRRVAEIGAAFGMRVLVNSRTRKEPPEGGRISWAEKDELLGSADIVTLHCPLTPDTADFIDREAIDKMKDSAWLINTARGGCVNERDLADALNAGRLAGAAVDVASAEPMAADNPLLKARNIIITPHIAWATPEARKRLLDIAGENLGAYLRGEKRNVVN